jgi:hypothetical protein
MNLFEGQVSGVSGNQIVIDAKGLGRIAVPIPVRRRVTSASPFARRRSASIAMNRAMIASASAGG